VAWWTVYGRTARRSSRTAATVRRLLLPAGFVLRWRDCSPHDHFSRAGRDFYRTPARSQETIRQIAKACPRRLGLLSTVVFSFRDLQQFVSRPRPVSLLRLYRYSLSEESSFEHGSGPSTLISVQTKRGLAGATPTQCNHRWGAVEGRLLLPGSRNGMRLK
jgi:hypothetical protein